MGEGATVRAAILMSRAVIEVEGAILDLGETVKTLCPWCNGGASGEKSMYITRREDRRLAYHCFRAKCKSSGYIGPAGPEDPTRQRRVFVAKEALETRRLADEEYGEIRRVYGVHAEAHDIQFSRDRYALPVMSPLYERRGWVLRIPPGCDLETHQKALTHKERIDCPWIGWTRVSLRRYHPGAVVVVEDLLSAFRVAQLGLRAVALNGTHLPPDALTEIVEHAEEVYWALDRDAFDKASRYASEYRSWFRRSLPVLLEKDVKNSTDEENMVWLREISLLP